jgi:hypothetical protein
LQIGNIEDSLGKGVVFQLELKDRNYTLRTKDLADAERWMNGLLKLRNSGQENLTIVEESHDSDDDAKIPEDDRQPLRPVEYDAKKEDSAGASTSNKDGDWEKPSARQNKCCLIS